MDIENQEAVYCEDDGEYRINCGIYDNLCKERFWKNHPKSQPQTKNIRERELINKWFQIMLFLNMYYHCEICDKTIR